VGTADIPSTLAKLDLSYLTDVRTEETPASKSPKKQEPVTAFNRLVLEKGHEPMIVSLIAQHFRDKKSSTSHREEFDIVKGKGNAPSNDFGVTD
jgi:hypothetical protein